MTRHRTAVCALLSVVVCGRGTAAFQRQPLVSNAFSTRIRLAENSREGADFARGEEAPEAVEASLETEETGEADLPALKSQIFAACAAADRGFAASPSDREEIEDLLAKLSKLSPIDDPARGISEGDTDAPLSGCWRLVYTSATDVSTLGANPLVAVGGIYQDARNLPIITNVIDCSPRVIQNLSPSAAAAVATATRLKVQTRARPRSSTRVGLNFESIKAEPLTVLGQPAPSWLPTLQLPLPQLGLDLQRRIFGVDEDQDPRDASTNPAFFDVRYLDDDFLVIQQGSPGGMFAAIKVDDLAK